jgi:CubicO group peptidase (beta-lactamase class C family)
VPGAEDERLGAVDVPLVGQCDPRFAAVRDEFARNFAERGELGAAVCVLVEGRAVVDLAGGWADESGRPWQLDTLVDYYSVGKAFLALLALQLVDAALLDLDDPIVKVWPEFGAGGKEGATVRHALCHRAGVPAIRAPLTNEDLWDWDRMTMALAATEAWWQPGTRHAYHTNTYGHLVGEVVRRVGGERPARRLAAVARSVGADVHIGVPVGATGRCADVRFVVPGRPGGDDGADNEVADVGPAAAIPADDPGPPVLGVADAEVSDDARMEMLSYFNPPGYSSIGVVNTAPWRRAEVPSTNGHGSARGVARLYGALLEPGRLLSPGLLAEATSPQSTGYCPILHEDVTFGLGFKPTVPRRPFGPNPSSYGHFGTGGAVGFADPDAGVAFGYVMNDVIPRWQSTRNRALIDAVYASL